MNERQAQDEAARKLDKGWKATVTEVRPGDFVVDSAPLAEHAGEPLPDRDIKGGR